MRERGVKLVTERPCVNCEVPDGSTKYGHVMSRGDDTCHQFLNILINEVAPLRWPRV